MDWLTDYCAGRFRFIAVTRPIQYAKHRSTYRVPLTLALTWVISILISSPIVLGANYTERRSKSPTLCTFYNADFIIYSSMGSFYMPCVAMLLLYWKIFRVINDRVRRSRFRDTAPSSSGVDTVTPVQSPPWPKGRRRDPGAAADVSLETSNNWPASLRPGGLRQVADNLSISGCETFIYSICLNEFPTTSNRFSRFTFFAFYTLIWEETALLRRLQPTFPAPQNADAENVEV